MSKPRPKPKTLLEEFASLGAQKALADSRELARLKRELADLEARLRTSVPSSIKACLDVEHAALAAASMLDVAFARLRRAA